jgi:apolipoprotein N-acyltransferase
MSRKARVLAVVDWIGVWLIVFLSVALSTFVVDPSGSETTNFWVLIVRAAILATAVTLFYGSWVWVRRETSTVPQDIQDKLPANAPGQ